MSEHLETETLVSVGAALDWRTGDTLRHLTECRCCREELERLATVYEVVAAETEPAQGFTDRVMAGIAEERATRPRRGWSVTVGSLVNPLLAGVSTLFTVGLAAQAGPMPMGPAVVAIVLGAMSVTFWVNRRRTLTAPGRSSPRPPGSCST